MKNLSAIDEAKDLITKEWLESGSNNLALQAKTLHVGGNASLEGETLADSIIAGSLLVNGDARFVNTIQGNVATATKLATSRLFWGQSFDGSGNVTGDMSSVGSISMNGALSGATTGAFSQGVTMATSSGNVGIGTSTPSSVLHISSKSTGPNDPIVRIDSAYNSSSFGWLSSSMASNLAAGGHVVHIFGQAQSSGNSGWIGYCHKGKGSANNYLALGLYSANDILNITYGGKVGIGTTSPSGKLDVRNNAANILELHRTNTNGGAFVDYYAMNQTAQFWRVGSQLDHSFGWLYAGAIPKMVLSIDGKLYLNGSESDTNAPHITYDATNHAFHIAGNLYADGFISAGGISSTTSGGGIDPDAMWELLGASTTEKINVSHLPDSIPVAKISGLGTMAYASTGDYLPLSGGTIDAGNNAAPLILKGGMSNYREGLRIMPTGSWSDIVLAGNDASVAAGISANSWFIGNNNGNFYITRNGSTTSTSAILKCESNTWSINGNTIYHSGNLPAYPTKASWNYDDVYLKLSGGTMSLDGPVIMSLKSTVANNWTDGIRFNSGGASSWAGFTIGGTQTSGTGDGIWSFLVHDKNFYLSHNGSSRATYMLSWTNAGALAFKTSALTNNGYTLLDANNYTSYAPKLDGTGATGTWGINISGNAATATTATSLVNSRTIWGRSFNGSANVSGFATGMTGFVSQSTKTDDWSDGINNHPWYGIDYTHSIQSTTLGEAYSSIASYFGLYLKTSPGYYTVLDTGRVGIGTSSPTEKLEVNGAVKVVNGDNGRYAQITRGSFLSYAAATGGWALGTGCYNNGGTTSFGLTAGLYGIGDTPSYYCYGGSYNASAMYIKYDTKRVGIGTNNPSYLLDVNGETRTKGLRIWNGTKEVPISVDSDGNLKFDGNIYATGFVSAGGVSDTGSSGGGLDWTELTTQGTQVIHASHIPSLDISKISNLSSASVASATSASALTRTWSRGHDVNITTSDYHSCTREFMCDGNTANKPGNIDGFLVSHQWDASTWAQQTYYQIRNYGRILTRYFDGFSNTYSAWKTVAWTDEIPSLSGYATETWVNNQGFLKSHQSLANYVTLNSAQTITAKKTFTGDIAVGDCTLTYDSTNKCLKFNFA